MPETINRISHGRLQSAARYILAAVTALTLYCALLTLGADDAFALRVTMKRVVFEGPRRTEMLTIVNNTAEEQTYRLGWRRMRMTETQSLVSLPEDDPGTDLKPVDDMVRFAPRRVVLPPGTSQQIRLMLRRPKDLPDGEYRSHFWIQPEAESVKFDPVQEKAAGKPAVQIKMLTGMTLPVFVRSGNLTATAKITDLKVAPGDKGLAVSMTIYREGTRSLFGEMEFYCPGVGMDKPWHEVRGIAVYTETPHRTVRFDVPLPEQGAAACNGMTVKYVAPDDDMLFKGAVMAQAAAG